MKLYRRTLFRVTSITPAIMSVGRKKEVLGFFIRTPCLLRLEATSLLMSALLQNWDSGGRKYFSQFCIGIPCIKHQVHNSIPFWKYLQNSTEKFWKWNLTALCSLVISMLTQKPYCTVFTGDFNAHTETLLHCVHWWFQCSHRNLTALCSLVISMLT